MTDQHYAEQLSLRLHCPGPECGQSFQKYLAHLAGRASVACPRCTKPVDLGEHRRAIDEFLALAATLDRLSQESA